MNDNSLKQYSDQHGYVLKDVRDFLREIVGVTLSVNPAHQRAKELLERWDAARTKDGGAG